MDTIYVIMKSVGEYSDRSETPLFYVTDETDAQGLVRRLDLEVRVISPPKLEIEWDVVKQSTDRWTTPRSRYKLREDVEEVRARNVVVQQAHEEYINSLDILDKDQPNSAYDHPYYFISEVKPFGTTKP